MYFADRDVTVVRHHLIRAEWSHRHETGFPGVKPVEDDHGVIFTQRGVVVVERHGPSWGKTLSKEWVLTKVGRTVLKFASEGRVFVREINASKDCGSRPHCRRYCLTLAHRFAKEMIEDPPSEVVQGRGGK